MFQNDVCERTAIDSLQPNVIVGRRLEQEISDTCSVRKMVAYDWLFESFPGVF